MSPTLLRRPFQHSFDSVDVRGLEMAVCSMPDIQGVIQEAIDADTVCRIATINLDFLRLADERSDVLEALQGCEMRVADGWPLLRLAELAGTPLPGRVTGSDLVPMILGWARQFGWRVGLVGGMEETKEALERDGTWSDVICGHWMPFYKGLDVRDEVLCNEIRASGANVLFVALGCPKQEVWMNENLQGSGAQVALGIGASLEFLANIKSRAPGVIQALRLEFAYRMMMEPRRLGGRYWRDYVFWRKAHAEAKTAAKQP